MNLENALNSLQQRGWKDVSTSRFLGYGLDRVFTKPVKIGFGIHCLLIKQFELLDAKAAMVWEGKCHLLKEEANKGQMRKHFIMVCLVAKKVPADVLLMIKTGALGLSPRTDLVVVDQEENLYWGILKDPYIEAKDVLFS